MGCLAKANVLVSYQEIASLLSSHLIVLFLQNSHLQRDIQQTFFCQYFLRDSSTLFTSILVKKVLLESCSQNSQESTCVRGSNLIMLQAYGCKKETLVQVFSCKFSEISKNTFFKEHLWTTACGFCLQLYKNGAQPTVFAKTSDE